MANLFLIILLVSIVGFFMGLTSPVRISKLTRLKLSRGKAAGLFGGLIVLSFIGIGVFAPPVPPKDTLPTDSLAGEVAQNQPTKETPSETQPSSETPPPPEPTANFSVVYEVKNKRYDGGNSYYILIDPVDLSNDKFKEKIQMIVSQMVKDKGGKISIEIHDKKSTLELSYKNYGDLSLGRPMTAQENEEQAKHQIASFSGELATGAWPNTLMFFPATFKDHPVVGKYVEFKEWNP